MNSFLKPQDYEEQACPLCIDNLKNGTNITKIPTGRVIDKLDEYLNRNDYDGALRHLLYWKSEAEFGNDLRGKFSVLNELLGLYRKTGKKEEAINTVHEILDVIKLLDNETSVSSATAYLNCATVYKAFGILEPSLRLFEKATEIYEKELKEDDSRLGGLYNNFGLLLCDLKRFDEALNLYEKAIETMKKAENGDLEVAITYLNIADVYEKMLSPQYAESKINECLSIAENIILSHNPQDGYYAFVIEKCAPTFNYYGRFALANELEKKAKEIYERA